ncbi:hypothetical protein IJJ12_03345 [bacterium]|nr:hypothetical protein [bacterium]
MKKYLPFILPAAALVLVVYFGWRWYRSRNVENLPAPEVTAETPIATLPADERTALDKIARGLGNYQTSQMTPSLSEAMGEIRYEIVDGRVRFAVNANLPVDDGEVYRLFYKTAGSDDFQEGSTLSAGKGGLIASNAVSVDDLPLSVQVRLLDQVILEGQIQAN